MALVACRECKEKISTKATACPKCGAPAAKGTPANAWIGLFVVGGLIVWGMAGIQKSVDEDRAEHATVAPVAPIAPTVPPPTIAPPRDISWRQIERDSGCTSRNSEDKKQDLFASKYKDRWFRIDNGRVESVIGERLGLTFGSGLDLVVTFPKKGDVYDLKKGERTRITVKLTHQGGCILPFYGETG